MLFGIKKRDDAIGTEVDAFRSNITRLFDEFFNLEPSGFFQSSWNPAVDIEEDDKYIYVKADIPGIEEKDLRVTIENNMLSITGEKNTAHRDESKDKRILVSERSYGKFSRTIQLPGAVQGDKTSAEFKKGVLNIRIPKISEKKNSRIAINVK